MKMAAVTIAVGSNWKRLAEQTSSRIHKATGLPVQVLDESAMRETGVPSPGMLKLWLLEVLSAENILYFDANIAFVRKWDPNTFADRPEIAGLRDDWWRPEIAERALALGMMPETFLSSGMFILNRRHHSDWLRIARACRYERSDALDVGACLNLARVRLSLPLTFLSRRLNISSCASPLLRARAIAELHHVDDEAAFGAAIEKLAEGETNDVTAKDDENDGIAGRSFWYRIDGRPDHLIQLRADGMLQAPQSSCDRFWFVSKSTGTQKLYLADESEIRCCLALDRGIWSEQVLGLASAPKVTLVPPRGECLADLIRSLEIQPRSCAVIGTLEGMTCQILLERFDELELFAVISAQRGIQHDEAREDLTEATQSLLSRRFIVDAPHPSAALSVVPDMSLNVLFFGVGANLTMNLIWRWLDKVRPGGVVVWEQQDPPARVSQLLARIAEVLPVSHSGESGLAWLQIPEGTAYVSPIHQTKRWRGPDFVSKATAFNVAHEFLQSIEERPTLSSGGRGIVICGGGLRYFPCAWVCINILRHKGCRLPIELWGLNQSEIGRDVRALVEPLGVRCIDASTVCEQNPVRTLGGWELKPFAMLHSEFQEILYLDADNVAVEDPTGLFDVAQFHERGAVFWPDYGRLGRDRSIWEICHVPYRDEPEFESGQILIDKARCWRPLHLAMHLNEYSDFYYQHVHGDKETFHMAWRMLAQEYAMIPRPIHRLQHVMCQHDFRGKRLFQHRNLAKWSLQGPNPRIAGFWLEEECLALLEDLRKRWSGSAASSQPKSRIEEMAMREIVEQRWFNYVRVGHDVRPIELLAGGQIGEGHAECEESWHVRVNSLGRLSLLICGRGTVTCRLRRREGPSWHGRWLIGEQMPIALSPLVR